MNPTIDSNGFLHLARIPIIPADVTWTISPRSSTLDNVHKEYIDVVVQNQDLCFFIVISIDVDQITCSIYSLNHTPPKLYPATMVKYQLPGYPIYSFTLHYISNRRHDLVSIIQHISGISFWYGLPNWPHPRMDLITPPMINHWSVTDEHVWMINFLTQLSQHMDHPVIQSIDHNSFIYRLLDAIRNPIPASASTFLSRFTPRWGSSSKGGGGKTKKRFRNKKRKGIQPKPSHFMKKRYRTKKSTHGG